MTLVLVQVAVAPGLPQVQPLPLPDTKLSPVGIASVTVVVPETGLPPPLCTTMA